MNKPTSNLCDYCEFINGGTWKQTEYDEIGHPVVQVSNIKNGSFELENQKFLRMDSVDRYRKNSIAKGDLIIATVGSHPTQPSAAGRAAVANDEIAGMLLNQNAVLIRSQSKELMQQYLCLIGRSPSFQTYIRNAGKGAANQVRIAIGAIKAFQFLLPTIQEQSQVTSIISAYDDLIENNLRRIALLEESARLLYREWFVHLRFPGHETTKIIDGVPEGWEKKNLFEVADALYGYSFKSKQFNESNEGLPVVRIRDIPRGYSKTYTLENAPTGKLLSDGDFLIGMDGEFHQNYWVGGKAWINQRVVRISPKNALTIGFLRESLRRPIEHFNQTIAGTTVAHLGAKHLKRINVLIPDTFLLNQANKAFDDARRQIVILSKQNSSLVKARDHLLPRLMDGRVEV